MVRQRDPRALRRVSQRARPSGRAGARAGSDEAKSAFLSLVSHELKTPLNTILGQADLLMRDSLPDHAQQAVAAIRQAGEGLFALIGDMLEISRLDEAAKPDDTELDVRMLADSVRSLTLGEARRQGLDFEIAVDPAVPARLTGDTARIRQVLMKLIANALKFTERGGITVSVGLTADGEALKIAVADSGVGVDPADQARIFAAFEQGEDLLTRSHGGLGLTLAARLVRAMGGAIGLDSRPAIGTTFWFTVPVGMPSDAVPTDMPVAEDERIEPALARRLRGLSVLAAEDNPLNRAALARVFEACGIEAEMACDGLEAVEAAGRRSFDVVLLDAHMPVAGGVQAARMLRTLGRRQQVPYLMIACAAGDPAENEARDVADAILRKPLSARGIVAALTAAIDGARPAPDALDTASLADLETSVGRGVLIDILRSYMGAAEAMTARIEAALPGEDALALEQAARDLASAAGGLGLAALTAAAQDLSQAARDGSVSGAITAQAERLVALSTATHEQLVHIYPDLAAA
ncbi:MAG: ATP-binding protein [Micropepsaceae bacterium]